MARVVLFVLFFSMFFACDRWNVNTMSSRNLLVIPEGEEEGQVQLPLDDQGLTDLSLSLSVFDDKVLIVDNALKRVQVLSMDGKPRVLIGSPDNVESSSVRVTPFSFSVIGQVAMDGKNNLYIQNRLEPQYNTENDKNRSSDFSPSYILIFNEKGELSHTLGRSGAPDVPFYYIEKLFVDMSDRLHVISRSFDTWSIYRFTGTVRDFNVNLAQAYFDRRVDGERHEGKIEHVAVTKKGESLIVAVAYYHDMRFKYRKVFEYSVVRESIERELMELQDPKNVFFALVDDQHYYFWDMIDNIPRFMITDAGGKRVNTLKIELLDDKAHYSRMITSDKGAVFSYHILENMVKLYLWE